MQQVFGLSFTNDSQEFMQFGVDTDSGEVKVRFTRNGEWTAWQRIDVKRTAGGELDETVRQAKSAESADRFTLPVKFVFQNAVTGALEFDGSEGEITANLAVGPGVSSVIQDHINEYLSNSNCDCQCDCNCSND